MMKRHALSAAFPSMSVADFESLTSDIAEHGLRAPVVLFQGEVLDGWHRYTACLAAGVEPTFAEFEGNDPVAFVISHNLQRRQLTGSQRAASIVACSEWQQRGGSRVQSAPGAHQMAEQAEVSTRTIVHAKAAHAAGLGDEVRDGKVSAKRAAEIAKLPKEDWQASLQRKSDPKPAPDKSDESDEPPEDDETSRIEDLVLELEALRRVVESDDRLAAAWDEAKTARAELEQLKGLLDHRTAELAEIQRAASSWKRKFEQLQKKAAGS